MVAMVTSPSGNHYKTSKLPNSSSARHKILSLQSPPLPFPFSSSLFFSLLPLFSYRYPTHLRRYSRRDIDISGGQGTMASSEENSSWLFDLSLIEDLPVPETELPCLGTGFDWPDNAYTGPTPLSGEFDDSIATSHGSGSRKRARTGTCGAPETKAFKEKLRRDKLNDRFQELSGVLEPGRPPKTDKTVILSDAVRMVIQLRDEAQKLKGSYENLQEKVNELKAEKNELRDEKQKLKEEKDKLELQVKALNPQNSFVPHPAAIPAPFPAPPQMVSSKLVPVVGYPGVPMWQFMPRTAVDTSEDHVLRPPVA